MRSFVYDGAAKVRRGKLKEICSRDEDCLYAAVHSPIPDLMLQDCHDAAQVPPSGLVIRHTRLSALVRAWQRNVVPYIPNIVVIQSFFHNFF